MRYHTLPQIEERFKTEAANFLKSFSLPVSGEPSLMLNGTLYTPPRKDYFFPTQHPKERIVLHFTAGNVRSDMMSLTQASRHVSVAFVIGRDGTIYQLFPSAAWSGHIGAGVGNQGTGNSQDKSSVGIEISNYGYLVPQGNTLETIYSRIKNPQTGAIGAVDPYCSLDDKEAFQRTDTPFRGQTHYASCTPQQVESTIILLRFLTAKYNIPRQFLPEEKRYITTNDVLQFKGIVSHVNYRSAGKWDIGPIFDWNTLIAGVQAPSFTRKLTLSRGIPALTSEKDINAQFPVSRGMEEEETDENNDNYNPHQFDKMPLQ